MSETNKAVVRRLIDRVLYAGNLELIDDIYAGHARLPAGVAAASGIPRARPPASASGSRAGHSCTYEPPRTLRCRDR
jgi:hypothetical protein